MIFTEATFTKCLSKLNEINAIMFFQQNFGLAVEMAKEIEQNFQYDEICVIDFQDTEKNFFSVLQQNMCNDFFASKKILKVYNFKPNGNSKLKDELNSFLNKNSFKDKIVLFFAPDLDGKSSFKTMFEKGDFTASIACYPDDEKTACKYVQNFFYDKNIKITPQLANTIAEMLHGDRKLLANECEKISLYVDAKDVGSTNSSSKEITIEDIENTIINEQQANPLIFIDNVLAGKIQSAIREFDLLKKEDVQMISLMRLFLQVVEQILDIKTIVQNGSNIDDAIKSKFFFWKRIPLIKIAVTNSTIEMLENYMKIALQTEKIAKRYGNNIAIQYFTRNAILYKI